jgi:hypothetical protein
LKEGHGSPKAMIELGAVKLEVAAELLVELGARGVGPWTLERESPRWSSVKPMVE